MVLLALATTRAAAQDGDFDDARGFERRIDLDDDDDADVDYPRGLARRIDLGDVDDASGFARRIDLDHPAVAGQRIADASTLSPMRFASGVSTAASATGRAASDEAAELGVEGAPPLSAVVDATLRSAGLAVDPVPSWRTRSRWSALVPAISSRVGNSQSWREVTDPTVNRALSYDVRVSWRLDRLIYDPNEPRFTAFDISRRRERRRLIALATHAYVTWLHARRAELRATHDQTDDSDRDSDDAGAGETGRGGSSRAARRTLIEARLAHAELDALTDGWFSQTLSKTRDHTELGRPTTGRLPDLGHTPRRSNLRTTDEPGEN